MNQFERVGFFRELHKRIRKLNTHLRDSNCRGVVFRFVNTDGTESAMPLVVVGRGNTQVVWDHLFTRIMDNTCVVHVEQIQDVRTFEDNGTWVDVHVTDGTLNQVDLPASMFEVERAFEE